jgi:pyridoxal phosphate enzyme (YggS family)
MSLLGVLERIEQACHRAGRHPDQVRLVAVTKGHTANEIQQHVLAHGRFVLGESRMQEALPKMEELPGQEWHFIGPLQRNKARFAAQFSLVHSIDSWRLAQFLSQKSQEQDWVQPVLLEVNLAREPQKHGFLPEELAQYWPQLTELPGLEIRGLMTVAPNDPRPEVLRPVFAGLSQWADRWNLPERSMGMSADFELAIAEGATLVRVGRLLFEPDPT